MKLLPKLLLVALIATVLPACGMSPLDIAVVSSNAAAATLRATHAELMRQRKDDEMAAAAAVVGERGEPATVAKQLAAASAVGDGYKPAWERYTVARFAWLRVVAAIKLARDNPALFNASSVMALLSALASAQSDLEAYARDTMRGVATLSEGAPPPAP